MDQHETEQPSGLARFAIPQGEPVPPLSAHLVKDFEAAVSREHFDNEGHDEEE